MDRLTDFSGKEEVWLRAFVTWVLARQCPLKRIEITFKPNPENSRWYEFGDLVYPWDRMDTVGAEVYRHYGIVLTYSPPLVSKAGFSKLVHHFEREAEKFQWPRYELPPSPNSNSFELGSNTIFPEIVISSNVMIIPIDYYATELPYSSWYYQTWKLWVRVMKDQKSDWITLIRWQKGIFHLHTWLARMSRLSDLESSWPSQRGGAHATTRFDNINLIAASVLNC
jgi:hypothetical protein